MKQSRTDSLMEATTNTAIGFVLSMITWHFVALAFGIPMPLGKNLEITGIFTVVSLTRAYVLRRLFDGRTVWQALKDRFTAAPDLTWPAVEARALQARLRVQQLIERP